MLVVGALIAAGCLGAVGDGSIVAAGSDAVRDGLIMAVGLDAVSNGSKKKTRRQYVSLEEVGVLAWTDDREGDWFGETKG